MARKPTSKRPPKKADVKAAADRAEMRAKGEEPIIAKVEIDPAIVMADEIKTKMGRPSKYKPEFARIAAALCKRGATDFELAEEFEVSTVTIWRWTVQHEDFCNAVVVGKNAYDDRIERALAQRASGYSYHTQKVFNFQGAIVRADVVEHVPADIGAAKLWLTNRRPDRWRDVQKFEHGNPGDFDQMSEEELDQFIAEETKAVAQTLAVAKLKGKASTRH